eukprot:s1976_g4.t1
MLHRFAAFASLCGTEAVVGPSSGCGSHRRCTSLEPGEWLAPGEWLTSPSDRYIAVLQADYLEVLETASFRTRWATPAEGRRIQSTGVLTAAHVADGSLLLEAGMDGGGPWIQHLPHQRSVNIRFTITATRGGGDARMPQGVQLSEFLLWRAGKPVQPTASNVSCTAGVGPSYQGPRNAVDGNLRTKWWVSSEPNVTLAMAFSHLPRDGPFLFGFTTGDDMPSRDPVRWLLEASLDGQSWMELHRQDTNFATPTSRFSMTRLFDVTAKFAELLGRAHVEERRNSPSNADLPVAMLLTDLGALTLKAYTQRTQFLPQPRPCVRAREGLPEASKTDRPPVLCAWTDLEESDRGKVPARPAS